MSQAAEYEQTLFIKSLSPAPGEFVCMEDLDGEVVITARIRSSTGKTRAQTICLTPGLATALAVIMHEHAMTGMEQAQRQELARLRAELEAV